MAENEIKASLEKREKGKGQNLVITIPVDDPPVLSKNKKALLLYSSRGWQKTDVVFHKKVVALSMNVCIPKD